MPESSYDCVVIGSGPGGYVTAIRAAQLGMKTACIEKDQVGGRCLNYACIPAKAVLRVADVLSEIREADEFGIKVSDPEIDYAGVSERRKKVVSTLTGGVAGLLKKNKVDFIEGEATLTGKGTLTVGGQEISAKTIVLATGSVKRPIPGAQFGGRVIGTEEAWALDELPKSHGGGRRRRVGLGDRLGLRAPRRRGDAVRGAGPRPAHRGRRHLQAGRARLQAPGHHGAHQHAGHRHRRRATASAAPSSTATSRARWTGWSSPPAAAPTSRPWAWTRRASSSPRTA